MAKLDGTAQTIQSGKYNILSEISVGTADIQFSVDETGFVSVPGGALTSSTGITLDLPQCQLKAVLTGDAVLAINAVSD